MILVRIRRINIMKNAYLPEAQNDRIFAFLGNFDKTSLIVCGTLFAALIALIIFITKKRGKGDKY